MKDAMKDTIIENLELVLGEELKKNLSISVAESCTGGLLGSRITDVPGSSAYFMGGMIVYSNEAKIKQLQVAKDTIRKYGAVSEETARKWLKTLESFFKQIWVLLSQVLPAQMEEVPGSLLAWFILVWLIKKT